jgi:hypothetical protein
MKPELRKVLDDDEEIIGEFSSGNDSVSEGDHMQLVI